MLRHALRGAILPVVSFLGPAAAGIMTGSFVVETLFGVPGMGQWFVKGAINRDYSVVLGTALVYASLVTVLQPARRPRLRVARPARAERRMTAAAQRPRRPHGQSPGAAGAPAPREEPLRRGRARSRWSLMALACFLLPAALRPRSDVDEPRAAPPAAVGRALVRHRRARPRLPRARARRRAHVARSSGSSRRSPASSSACSTAPSPATTAAASTRS